ncbi:MAG: excisionase family DNA-binding protein [Pyrinomonadaceae bacterium]|nr:excisionase family DNA-binding protein [Pyrinomonadaceae bacterium]MBP6211517.1 excisionase family DNA-binding protein [Pyrinomonadaceae bacterium]
MTSNLRLLRICGHCGEEFTARTTVTKFCSQLCGSRAYKQRARKSAAKRSDRETESRISAPLTALQAQDFLSVDDACILLGVSRWTIGRAVKSGKLRASRLGRRILIRRLDVDQLFPC